MRAETGNRHLHQASTAGDRSTEPLQHWHFFAVCAATPSGFRWQWQKQGIPTPVTSAPFDFYFDCISDAREKGYAGPLPAGTKVPLQRLPLGPLETERVLASLAPNSNDVVTVTAVSAADVKGRRTHGRSRVT